MLESYLNSIRDSRCTFDDGLNKVLEFTRQHRGSVRHETVEDVTVWHVTLPSGDSATCFKPYDDINLFYFES